MIRRFRISNQKFSCTESDFNIWNFESSYLLRILITPLRAMKNPLTRRHFIKTSTLAAGAGITLGNWLQSVNANETVMDTTSPTTTSEPGEVSVQLLDGKPLTLDSGASFGVPWKQGSVPRTSTFQLSSDGKQLPLQSWPLAYWPDGSLKWSGFATVVPANVSTPMRLSVGKSDVAGSIKVTNSAQSYTVDTGPLKCVIPVAGSSSLVESMTIDERPIVGIGQLVCILQNGPQTNAEDSPAREKFISQVKKVTVEQPGPVRAVLKLEGVHKGVTSGREWLPFVVRLYFYTGQTAVRMVHTITFDGDQEKDFVRGLGLQFGVPLREEARNRTVRFVGADGGVWSEPLQIGGGSAAQETGQPFTGRGPFAQNAIWDDFKLAQANPEGFTIVKRTNPKSTWLFSAAGKRAAGLGFVGDLGGGLAVRVKNFWQSYPAGLEVRRASSPSAELIAWLWSPDGPQMDMRHYDLMAHGLDASYEDVQPGMSTAYGVSRTSELTLFPNTSSLPSRTTTVAQADAGGVLPLLAASPDTFIQPAFLEYGVCQTGRHLLRKVLRKASMQYSRSMRSKSTRATGTASGSLAISCIPILRHVTFGTTTGAVTRGTTLSWEFRCGFGTAFCALDAVKYFVLPRLTRETRAKRIFIPLDQWLVLARVTM